MYSLGAVTSTLTTAKITCLHAMKKYPSIAKRPLCVDLLWGPDVLAGAALTVVDVLHTINALSVRQIGRAHV